MRWTTTNGTVLLPEDGSLRIVNLNGKVLALDQCGAEWLQQLISEPERFFKMPGAADFAKALQSAGVVSRESFIQRTRVMIHNSASLLLIAFILPAVSFLPSLGIRLRWLMTVVKLLIYTFGWKTLVSSIVACRQWLIHFPGLVNHCSQVELEALLMQAASQCIIGAACKERAILFFLLNLKLWPRVKIIVAFQWAPLGGHSWCEIDGEAFTDPDNLRLQGFERICTLP